jgi:hypothetical protein
VFNGLFHLAAIDAEFAGYRSLAVARAVARSYRLLQREGSLCHWWLVLLRRWYRVIGRGVSG